MSDNTNSDRRRLEARRARDLLDQISVARTKIDKLTLGLTTSSADSSRIVKDVQWHARALAYHFEKIVGSYLRLSSGIAARADADEKGVRPSAILMFALDYQDMMFDFYAFVNIAKITLDSLRMFLKPVFATDLGQIPKSISGVLKGSTDCPVYVELSNDSDLEYLCDLRDCLVHYRSLATSDNLIAVDQNLTERELKQFDFSGEVFDVMARATFRFQDEKTIPINMYLPDTIFDRNKSEKKQATFKYEKRYNILTFCRDIFQLLYGSFTTIFELLHSPASPKYVWTK